MGDSPCSLTGGGLDQLAVAAADGTAPTIVDTPFTHISQVVAGPDGGVLVVAGTPVDETAPYLVTIADDLREPPHIERLRPARDLGLDATPSAWFSTPSAVVVPTDDGMATHALVFLPKNPDVDDAEAATLPPLLVLTHGGPTSATRAQLNLTIQFWTSRGFCVADVNYRGSTGYGRAYRNALRGNWGSSTSPIASRWPATSRTRGGRPGPARHPWRERRRLHHARGAHLPRHLHRRCEPYGIADLEVLATDTHKFEARYLDSLVGPGRRTRPSTGSARRSTTSAG